MRIKWLASVAFLSACVGDFPEPPGQLAFDGSGPTPDGGCDPVVEFCNGLDDDCDGRTDERLPDRPCANAVGICVGAVESCLGAEGYSGCDPALYARSVGAHYVADEAPPLCNGLDDDCDGQADEGCACQIGETQACGSSTGTCRAGQQACADGAWGLCVGAVPPAAEVCDGADQDCDGTVDEGVLNACGTCGALPEEVCNAVDDDCDGQTDEGVLNACGTCGAVPAEICNAVDDDCDGQTDERVLNACGACGPPPAERCNGLDDDCDGRIDEAMEVCNGQDDDCDGRIDELPPRPCQRCDQLPCTDGMLFCEAGVDHCRTRDD